MSTFVRPTHEEVVEMIRKYKQRKQEWKERLDREWEQLQTEVEHEREKMIILQQA